ncbi:DoxX family protein [Amycolatopsis rhizosphaerae]|uniref:DoxX family protein n=1 Tax=Amycolatopsis rhizosphaerae TaxID=2053003 RepID=UPI0016438A9E|nr:DoxX family protein [Amycolatopsis rhizosphaerae]
MILRRVARPLLASIFIYGGIGALRQAEGHAEVAKPLVDKTIGARQDRLPPAVSTDPVTLVRADAAVKIVAGTLFAFGRVPRLSALALVGSLVPTTIAGHPFWEAKDDSEKQQQLIHFLKNAGLVGGLLIAAADTEGRPSLGWRARRAAAKASRQVQNTAETARGKLPG